MKWALSSYSGKHDSRTSHPERTMLMTKKKGVWCMAPGSALPEDYIYEGEVILHVLFMVKYCFGFSWIYQRITKHLEVLIGLASWNMVLLCRMRNLSSSDKFQPCRCLGQGICEWVQKILFRKSCSTQGAIRMSILYDPMCKTSIAHNMVAWRLYRVFRNAVFIPLAIRQAASWTFVIFSQSRQQNKLKWRWKCVGDKTHFPQARLNYGLLFHSY